VWMFWMLELVARGAGGFVEKGRFLWVIIRVCVGDIYCIDCEVVAITIP
jgi:hypothetical protein